MFPIRAIIATALFLPAMAGCSDDGQEAAPAADERPRVTVLASGGGLGDMGYNDLIMDGIMRFYERHDVIMSLIRPGEADNARQAAEAWLDNTRGGTPSLLVLAEESYEPLARAIGRELAANQRVLLFESGGDSLPQCVTSFSIDRYGAAWLAGRMCGEHPSATVIAARPGAATLDAATEGFADGYREGSGREASVLYLADGDEGYNMADSAYRMADQIDETIILPLAGGSNNGIYKHSREVFSLTLVIGMDADCSSRCQNLPYSLVIRVGDLVEWYMTAWFNGTMPQGHATYGIEDGAADIVVSPLFFYVADFFEDYFVDDPQYWYKAYDAHKDEAIRKESEHESK